MSPSSSSAQLRRGVIGPCILALLANGSKYGLQLVRELDESGQLLSSQGTVYPLLSRLLESGLVASRWEVGDSERPRRYYDITVEGRRELKEFGADWAQFASSVDTLLATVPTKIAKET
jgi:PadR family transcriptional regulator PadR